MEVDPGKAIEPLQMGKVTFYGESARAIRDAQEVLRAAGAGQLEVVKRAGQGDRPFAVIDGHWGIHAPRRPSRMLPSTLLALASRWQ